MKSKFHIVYPRGDKSKLTVAEVYPAYEINDYAVASKESFDDEDDAKKYCMVLAKQYDLELDIDGNLYLD